MTSAAPVGAIIPAGVDTRAAGTSLLAGVAEANVDIGPAVAVGILKGHQKPAGGRSIVAVIAAAPGVDVDHTVRGDDEVPGVTNIVREHAGAEAGGQRDSPVVIRAGFRPRRGRVAFLCNG